MKCLLGSPGGICKHSDHFLLFRFTCTIRDARLPPVGYDQLRVNYSFHFTSSNFKLIKQLEEKGPYLYERNLRKFYEKIFRGASFVPILRCLKLKLSLIKPFLYMWLIFFGKNIAGTRIICHKNKNTHTIEKKK